MFAFGIALKTILPGDVSLIGILNIVYWPIYGEIKILEKITNGSCLESGNIDAPCADKLTFYSHYFMLMVYMFIASVLLINLLIAMFR